MEALALNCGRTTRPIDRLGKLLTYSPIKGTVNLENTWQSWLKTRSISMLTMEIQVLNSGLIAFQTRAHGWWQTSMAAVRAVTPENTWRSWLAKRCTSVQEMEVLDRNSGRTIHRMAPRGWSLIFIQPVIPILVNSWRM